MRHLPHVAARTPLLLDPTPERIVAAFAGFGVVLDEVGTDLSIKGTVVASGTIPEWLLSLAAEHHGEIRAHLLAAEDVRCPHCNKKLGNRLVGHYETTCPRCKHEVAITR